MSRLLDSRGERIRLPESVRDLNDAIEEAEETMARMLSESLFACSPEDRVWQLRESVTGERQKRPVTGLAHYLPITIAEES